MLALAVLGVAAFNLAFRLDREIVTEWDESLYALSAWEMVQSGDWIGTTQLGSLDYYNTKPPLNVWLIALAFKAFGTSLLSLRLASALSAWVTIAVLQEWTRRHFGIAVALFSSLVLGTSYAFLFVHSGKSADTDALFTLLILLTVVALSAAHQRPRMLIWLGPLAAGAFLLRGMAVLMPLLIVLLVEASRRGAQRARALPLGLAALLFALPVGAWVAARWQVDQWQFLKRLFLYDFVARTTEALEGHEGSLLYYLDILQRHHYDWLLATAAGLLLFPFSLAHVRDALVKVWRANRPTTLPIVAWVAVTIGVPTVMRTKVPWYLTPFYPAFALGVGWIIIRGLSHDRYPVRRFVLACVAIVALAVAEGKLVWHSYYRRDPSRSVQGLLFAEQHRLTGHAVCRDHWSNAEIFVLEALIRSEPRICLDAEAFVHGSGSAEYWVTSPDVRINKLDLVRTDRHEALYRRRQ